jgi:hypothetical protein
LAVRCWALLACAVLTLGAAHAGAAHAAQPTPLTEAELAVAYAEPAIVLIEVTWVGFLRDATTGDLLDEARATLTGRCSGAGVSNDGYLVTTSDCLDPMSALPQALRDLVDRRVADGRTPSEQADQVYEELRERAVLLGESWSDLPERTVTVQRTVTPDGPLPATVASLAGPEDGDVALLKIERDNQPMLPLADEVDEDAALVLVELRDGPGVRLTYREASVAAMTPRPLASSSGEAGAEAVLPGGVAITQDAALAGLVVDEVAGKQVLTELTAIRELLTQAQATTEPGQVDTDFRAGVDAYHDGRFTEAIERFDSVLAIIPSHVQAHSYRDRAQQLREAEGGGPPTEKGLVTSVVDWLRNRSTALVGLGVLAAILFFLMHRRHDPAAHHARAADAESAADDDQSTDESR